MRAKGRAMSDRAPRTRTDRGGTWLIGPAFRKEPSETCVRDQSLRVTSETLRFLDILVRPVPAALEHPSLNRCDHRSQRQSHPTPLEQSLLCWTRENPKLWCSRL